MKTAKTLPLMLLGLLLLPGCQSFAPPAPSPVRAEDNVTLLLHHPQYLAAARAAPNFTSEALKTIARLEREKADAGVP